MKKVFIVLCVLILIATFGFLAKSTIEKKSLQKAYETKVTENDKSYVVTGSFTRSVAQREQTEKKLACDVQKRADYSDIVVPLAKQHGIDWRLVTAIMAAESSFNPCAVSPVGAMGLMQIMPAVAKEYEVELDEAFEPKENVRAGILLLKRLNKRYKGNLKLTVAAYNAGEGNVARYGGIPPFKETRNYVKKVLGYHSDLKLAKAKPMSGGSPLSLLKAR
jgi:soluble lytic murein transglycosylase-like protein